MTSDRPTIRLEYDEAPQEHPLIPGRTIMRMTLVRDEWADEISYDTIQLDIAERVEPAVVGGLATDQALDTARVLAAQLVEQVFRADRLHMNLLGKWVYER